MFIQTGQEVRKGWGLGGGEYTFSPVSFLLLVRSLDFGKVTSALLSSRSPEELGRDELASCWGPVLGAAVTSWPPPSGGWAEVSKAEAEAYQWRWASGVGVGRLLVPASPMSPALSTESPKGQSS